MVEPKRNHYHHTMSIANIYQLNIRFIFMALG